MQGAELKWDLEPRLIDLAIAVVKLTEKMPMSYAGKYYGGQLLRAAGSTALNYGESQGGATHRDFTNKLKIVDKEMREAQICLKIIKGRTDPHRSCSDQPHAQGGRRIGRHLHNCGHDSRKAQSPAMTFLHSFFFSL